ncbi:nucleoside hydrolase [Microbacterium sp. NPDC019599]|uniref:nucleoside hydrolase n=1 Tax=Microbacterium sp. NPDC019599 TaxID=3154690 RepID=UPI0033D803DE
MTIHDTRQIPLYVDCDTGIDDALALAYLLAQQRARIVGVGTVSGNTTADQAAHNTLAILELAGAAEIPVAIGAQNPLSSGFHGGAPSIHGRDGIGEVGLRPSEAAPEQVSATALLAQLAQESGGDLHILALGPLTNLAEFLTEYPDCQDLISEVVIMGGAFTRRGNVSAVAEANIHNDPEAAAKVFAARWPITVVPLDLTMRHLLTEQEALELLRIPGSLPPKLAAMLDVYFDAYEGLLGTRQCALHDPLAAMVVAHGVRVVKEDHPRRIEVILDGPERGRTRARITATVDPAPVRRVVAEIDVPAATVLLDAVRAYSWPMAPVVV